MLRKSLAWTVRSEARTIQNEKEKSFCRKNDFLAEGKKSCCTEKSQVKKVILSKECFRVLFPRIIWGKKHFSCQMDQNDFFIKNDLFLVHLTLKMILMKIAKIRKNHFMTKNNFILYGKNMTWQKTIFHFFPYNNTPLRSEKEMILWKDCVFSRNKKWFIS